MPNYHEAMLSNPIEEAIKRILDVDTPLHELVIPHNTIVPTGDGSGYDFLAMIKSLDSNNDEIIYICADFNATFTKHGIVLQHLQNNTTNIGISDFALEVAVEEADINQKISEKTLSKDQANSFSFKAHFLALKELIVKYDSTKYCYSY